MTAGDSNTGVANKTMEAPAIASSAPFVNIPRPLHSPRSQAHKRISGFDSERCFSIPVHNKCEVVEYSPTKKLKADSDVVVLTVPVVEESLPESPEARGAKAAVFTPDKQCRALKITQDHRVGHTLDDAIGGAMKLFEEAVKAYAVEYDRKGEAKANKFAEQLSIKNYEQYRDAILRLMPWIGSREPSAKGTYDVVEFQRRHAVYEEAKDLFEGRKRQMDSIRGESQQNRAWEALSAVLAAISSREEKVWLEYDDLQTEYLEKMLEKRPGCKAVGSTKRNDAIREIVPQLIQEGEFGAFAESLLDARCIHRVTFAHGPSGPLPATSMTFRRMTLWDALKTMDDDGPLRGASKRKEWCSKRGTQFALQDLRLDQEFGSKTERMDAQDLKPDAQLRELLCSEKPVVLLDTLAALAPRDVCKQTGLSAIVKAELALLMQEAKSRGEAVVFHLGGGNSHKLAERVYLRPPIADYGLRCGCLRWRESAKVPWARERGWDWRIRLCLQMP
jgi:hypothetical protein